MNNDQKVKTERVVIFIDGSNCYHSIKEEFSIHDNEKINFQILANLLNKNRLLVAVYYYNASLDRGYNEDVYWKQQKFFDEIRRIPGFHLVLCRMRKMRGVDGEMEYAVKGDDIQIAVDMVKMAYENQYDTAILLSGDGDFVPAIKTVQKLGKKVENAYFSVSRSGFLKRVCDSSLSISEEIIKKCLKTEK